MYPDSSGQGMATSIFQGIVPGERKPGRPKPDGKTISKTKLTFVETHQLTKDREALRKLVREINGAPTTNTG